MLTSIDTLKALYEKEKESHLNDYFTFLKFKSIATDPVFKKDVEQCANWLENYLKESGLQVEKWDTGRAPVIFASDLRAGEDKETLLIYCHYDVQPVDPLHEWTTPPFEPQIRDGEVFARGASDNKGQCFYTILALKALLKMHKQLPVNIKFLIEGEEESGSVGLSQILDSKKEALKADYLVIVDSGIGNMQTPAITLGARGIVALQMSLQEAKFDLHSGSLGGIAYNPNRALVKMLSQLHDDEGKVTVPGFYDAVIPLSVEEKEAISFDFDHTNHQHMFGFQPSGMEKGVSPHEAAWTRPTLEINGMWGGYTGAGFKTVIPAKAFAKISCRLVPNQEPETILKQVQDYLKQLTPPGMQLEVQIIAGHGKGFRTTPHSRIVKLMSESYSQVFGKPCKNILIGGSIPISVQLSEAAGAEMVLVGLGLPDDHIHAPNEHFGLERLEKGFLTICRAIELFK
jgi:acetylornithine deacetylase/succinyl-diaminopimelate desuccinylase-like protein